MNTQIIQATRSEVYLEDCVAAMKRYPDNYFDLAIPDPPYGIGFGNYNRTNKDSYGIRKKANKYKNSDWDKCPPAKEYFDELFRVSKNQIVCGGNYFSLPPTQGFIFWFKQNPVDNFSDGEYLWTSFNRPAKCLDYRYYGNLEGNGNAKDKIHPTQKPVALYDWIFKNYAKQGDLILDTHLGSGSSRIAADKAGLDFVGFEIDPEYFEKANERYRIYKQQQKLF